MATAITRTDIKPRVSHQKKIANDFQRAKDLMDIYYLYRHIREDKNEPFYIGIGREKNYRRAKKAGSTARNRIWKRIADKCDWRWEILLDGLTFEEACEKEIEFISLYGRIDLGTGSLANLTDGGEGQVNRKQTKKTREKISKNNARYWEGKKRPKVGEKISKALSGRKGSLCKNSKKIVGLSPEGVEEVFESQSVAASELSKRHGKTFHQSCITNCCNKKQKSHRGWKFKIFGDDDSWEAIIPNGGRPVKVTDLKTGDEKSFNSISDACRYYSKKKGVKVCPSTASRVANGERNKHRNLNFKLV